MTVIRDVAIRIRTERSGASGGGFEARAFAAEAKAAREAGKEIEGVGRATRETEMAFGRFQLKGVRAFQSIGRGALELGRGTAFLAASSQEDLDKMLRSIVAVEAGVGIFRGVADAGKGLTTVLGAGATSAVAYATAITGGFIALDYFSEANRKARREVEEFNIARERSRELGDRERNRLNAESGAARELRGIDLEIANLGLPQDQVKSLEAMRGRLATAQAGAAGSERAGRSRLAQIEAGTVFKAFQGETAAQVVDAEAQQKEIIRERIRVEQDLLHAKQRELQQQEELIRSNPAFGFKVPGIGPSGPAGRDAALSRLQAQKDAIESEAATILRGLLEMLRDQSAQVAETKKALQYLER